MNETFALQECRSYLEKALKMGGSINRLNHSRRHDIQMNSIRENDKQKNDPQWSDIHKKSTQKNDTGQNGRRLFCGVSFGLMSFWRMSWHLTE